MLLCEHIMYVHEGFDRSRQQLINDQSHKTDIHLMVRHGRGVALSGNSLLGSAVAEQLRPPCSRLRVCGVVPQTQCAQGTLNSFGCWSMSAVTQVRTSLRSPHSLFPLGYHVFHAGSSNANSMLLQDHQKISGSTNLMLPYQCLLSKPIIVRSAYLRRWSQARIMLIFPSSAPPSHSTA